MNRKALAYAATVAVPLGMTVPAAHLKPGHIKQDYCAVIHCGDSTLNWLVAPCYSNSRQWTCILTAYS
jgi:hypothetical protein